MPESEQVKSGQVLDLTIRQAEILGLTAQGFSRKEIGRNLGISVRTVEAHFSGMRRRTGARSDGELIARAAAAGSPAMALAPPIAGMLCDPGPETPAGAPVGYARAFTVRQNLEWQIRALKDVGCIHVFADCQSGRTAARPELEACLGCLRPGDTMVVPSLDRLSCSLQDLVTMVAGLSHRDLGFRSLHEGLDTTTPGGRLVFHVFTALAQFVRELIVQGTRERIAAAGGARPGRAAALTPEQVRHAWALLAHQDENVSAIAQLLGVSRATIYSHIPELVSNDRC